MGGPVRLELRGGLLDAVIGMEAPMVSYPRLEGAVTKDAKQILYDMQDRRCNACFNHKPLDQLTYDHRVPKSRASPRDIANAELMCAPCNREKDNNDIATFLPGRWETVV